MAANLDLPTHELNEFDLPAVCVVTGEQDAVSFKPVKFWWYPRWVPLLVFFPWGGPLLAGIVGLATRKKAEGELPFTDRGWSAWRRSKWIWGLSVFGFFVGLFVSIVVITAAATGSLQGWVAGAVSVLTIATPLTGWFVAKPSMLVVRKIENGRLTLGVPSEEAAMRIHAHLFPAGGRVMQALPVPAPPPRVAASGR